MNNLLKRIVITNWIPIKREQPLHTYLNNNNRRKQNMAQREQLTLCSSQVNKHKWKHNIKKLVCPRINIKKVNSWGNKRTWSFQDKCLYFKINIVKQLQW
jgi:hypothetical protein